MALGLRYNGTRGLSYHILKLADERAIGSQDIFAGNIRIYSTVEQREKLRL